MTLILLLSKATIELALMFVLARTVLTWWIGEQRHTNLFWQVLDRAAQPARAITRWCIWRSASPATVTALTLLWLALAWLVVTALKVRNCLLAGACS